MMTQPNIRRASTLETREFVKRDFETFCIMTSFPRKTSMVCTERAGLWVPAK